MTDANSKWIETVEKLLRKAEDPATSDAEREALVGKVTYLMAKFGIEQDMLNAVQNVPIVVNHRKFIIPNPYQTQKIGLLNMVCIAFGAKLVDTRRQDGKVSVIGTDADIERSYMLFGSLVIQLQSGMASAIKLKPAYEHGKRFNNAFVNGFVHTVNMRILQAAQRAKEDVKRESTGMELVLLNKTQLITNKVNEAFGRLTSTRSTGRSTSAAGYNAGRTAGSMADIGGARVSSQHATRRALS